MQRKDMTVVSGWRRIAGSASIPSLVALVIVVTACASACGAFGSTTASGPCGEAGVQARSGRPAVLDAAALLREDITVDPGRSGGSRCLPIPPVGSSGHLHVRVSDRVQFLANRAPALIPPGTKVLRVSTSPGPTTRVGGIPTPHVLVTLTAKRPGSVTVEWVDCSGTAC